MEAASAGCTLSDLVAFVLEMAGTFRARRDWWTPWLDGYGKTLDLDLIRLLLGAEDASFTCLGSRAWPGTRADLVRHLLDARTWQELGDLDRIEAGRDPA